MRAVVLFGLMSGLPLDDWIGCSGRSFDRADGIVESRTKPQAQSAIHAMPKSPSASIVVSFEKGRSNGHGWAPDLHAPHRSARRPLPGPPTHLVRATSLWRALRATSSQTSTVLPMFPRCAEEGKAN